MDNQLSLEFWWYGAAAYALCHLVHLILWNRRVSFCGTKFLFVLFLLVPLFGWSLLLVTAFDSDLVLPAFLHLLLSANYISIYPALQASSPTLTLLRELYFSDGLSEAQILERFPMQSLIRERVKDLESGKLICKDHNGNVHLSRIGSLLAGFFVFFRRLLNLPLGAG